MNITVFAQNLPNPNFETWTNMGTYEDPDNWITLSNFSSLAPEWPICVAKSTDSHSGTYACELETKLNLVDTTVLAGFVIAGTGDFLFSGVNYVANTVRPNSMLAYYKFAPINGDTAGISINLTKWDSNTNSQITVGVGEVSIIGSTSTYTLIEVPVTYLTSDTPDTMMIVAASSIGSNPQVGTKLVLDDISFSMSGAGVMDLNLYSSSIYPNPANDELEFKIDNAKPTEVVLIDMAGKEIVTYALNFPMYKINVSNLRQGSYIYQLKENGKIVSKGKINVIK